MIILKLNSYFLILFLFTILIPDQIYPCSRILIAENQYTVMVGRTMDWYEEMDTHLIFYPRNMIRFGNGSQQSTEANWMHWTSKYASIVATGYEHLTTDGLNEKGFAAHILWLEDSDYGSADASDPWLSQTQWTQYYLDNFETVEEAVSHTIENPFNVIPFFHKKTGLQGKLHMVLDDATGDSAILEYIDGSLKIHHDRKATVVTNEPRYEKQLENLKRYKNFGGFKSLPGLCDSSERFVRATYFTGTLPHYLTENELFSGVLSILNNIAQPYSTKQRTLWRTISDLTNRVYYFQSTQDQKLITLNFEMFDPNQETDSTLW